MKAIDTLLLCFLAAVPLGCTGSDTVEQDRFGEEEDGGDDDGVGTGDPGGTSGDPGGISGETGSGEPQGSTGENTGASGPTGSGSGGSSSSGTPCTDDGPDEPNESEASAASLGVVGDCDQSATKTVDGVLAGDDVDWYVYQGDDLTGCVVDPYRDVEADGGYRVCKFMGCAEGVAQGTCPEGTSAETSPDGLPGCCAQQAFNLPMDCPDWWDDSATVYIRVDKPPAYECVNYTLTIHF